MTKFPGSDTTIIVAGIESLLRDDRGGKRSLRWLAKRAGLSYSTLHHKLRSRPGRLVMDELFAIADALGVTILDIYAAGEAALSESEAA